MATSRQVPAMQFDFSDFSTTIATLRVIERNGRIPSDFMKYLQKLLKFSAVDDQLKPFLTFHWDENERVFERDWDMGTIRQAIGLMEDWQNRNEIELNKKRTHPDEDQSEEKRKPPVPLRRSLVEVPRKPNRCSGEMEEQAIKSPKNKPTVSPRISRQATLDVKTCDEKPGPNPRGDITKGVENQLESLTLEEDGQILRRWRGLVGNSVNILQPSEFTKIGKILFPTSQVREESIEDAISGMEHDDIDLRRWIGKVLPQVIQKIKMWGCGILEPESIRDLLEKAGKFEGDEENTWNDNEDLPMARIDLITCILNCVDVVVAQDLFRNMASFPVALPLIIPSIFENRMINLVPSLKYISIRSRGSNGNVEENFLLTPPYKMVLAIRLGRAEDVGKSGILNNMLKKEYTFSSKQEPGADYAEPISLPGFVEFVPLTEETCSEGLWKSVLSIRANIGSDNKPLLLANMHGDPWDHRDVFRTMLKLATGVLVFKMPEIDEEKRNDVWQELEGLFGDDLPYLNVVSDNRNKRPDVVTTIKNDVNFRKVRQALLKAFSLNKIRNETGECHNLASIPSVEEVQSVESWKLVEIMRKNSLTEIRCILTNSTENSGLSDTERSNLENALLGNFCALLKLPLKQKIFGYLHLQKELADETNKHSSAIRNELYRLQKQLTTTEDIEENTHARERLKNLITEKLDLLSEYNVGLEHFYRKLGTTYVSALNKQNDPKWTPLLDLPSYYAELVIHGHAIELLDGECSRTTINAVWFTAICDKISAVYPNLRIFVVSVIGLQSSGKSTLLNALFGCRFAVSVGRCTRGLFLRLLFLEDELREQLEADALVVIDMEGLGSPEKVNDPEFEKKDRLMTTFVMGISNLTLINISGESSNTMTDILQIAVVSMARLKDDKLSTDMFVVQYLSERNQQRVSQAHGEFIKAIKYAIKFTDEKGVYMGIKDSACMKNLVHRAEKGNVLKAFGPFRNGEHVNSPPSVGYHESVVDLYNSILEACKECDSRLTLDVWSKLLNGYLEAVHSDHVAVRFKSLVEMSEHLERGHRISETKEAIEKAFLQHESHIETEIRREIHIVQERNPKGEKVEDSEKLQKRLHQDIKKYLERIPNSCGLEQEGKSACNSCQQATTTMKSLFDYVKETPAEEDTVKTINKFIELTTESCGKRLENTIGAELLQKGLCTNFHGLINQHLAEYSKDGNARTKEECRQIAEAVWKKLTAIIDKEYPHTSIEERIAADIATVYNAHADARERYLAADVELEKKLAYNSKSGRIKDAVLSSVSKALNIKSSKKTKPLEKKLNIRLCCELKRSLNNLPQDFVRRRKIEHYSSGLMVSVQKEIEEAIRQFERTYFKTLLPGYKWEVHVYALKKFGSLFNALESKWESANYPKKVLEKNSKSYKQMILTRLRYGFSASGEGFVIANLLLKAVQQKASKHGSGTRINMVLDLPWLVNTENVRLRFFSLLAKKVADGSDRDCQEAILYFTNPESTITKWFRGEVDTKYLEEGKAEWEKTFETELELVMQNVRNTRTMIELKRFLDEYFTQVGSAVRYQSSVDDERLKGENFLSLKSSIEDGIGIRKSEMQMQLKNPSDSDRVMARLGCTQQCYWCGALCWGQRGHHTNQDGTKITTRVISPKA